MVRVTDAKVAGVYVEYGVEVNEGSYRCDLGELIPARSADLT